MSVAVPPPPRPSKSRLRTIDRSSTGSSISLPLSAENASSVKLRLNSPIPSYNEFPLPERSKYRSRFTEHFDQKKSTSSTSEQSLKEEEEEEIEDEDEEYFPQAEQQEQKIKTYNIGNLKGSHSLTSLTTESSFLRHSTSIKKRKSDTESLTQHQQKKEDKKKQEKKERPIVQLKSSKSTPLQSSKGGRKRIGSSGSIKLAKSLSYNKLPTLGSTNRAHVVIQRYENWLVFLKCIINWLDETSKISMTTSRAFSSRAAPHLKPKEGILTIRSGLKVLTNHVSEKQHAFSKQLDKHVHILTELRKLCKEKIHRLKTDPQLAMDELLRRAEVTRGKMNHLNRCCKQADKSKGQELEMDPWLANLYVLRQLKKEVDEENRLRLLMVTVQQDIKAFEKQVISCVKTAVEYSYTHLAPDILDGSNDPETAPFQQILDQVVPDHEWSQFLEQHPNDLVDEDQPTKDYLKFNYPNKLHPAVMTLRKGRMERKFGSVRKQFVQRYFVLSQGGYLHQFRLDDKVSPERTLYIPGSTVHPSVDINVAGHIESLYGTPKDGFTFDMFKPSTNLLLQHRDKSTSFRTETREDLVAWCRLIIMVSNGLDPSVVYEISSFPSFSSSIDDSIHSFSSIRRPSRSSSTQPGIPEVPESPTDNKHLSSKRTTESFNEPSYMKRGFKEEAKNDEIVEDQQEKQEVLMEKEDGVTLEKKEEVKGVVNKEQEQEKKVIKPMNEQAEMDSKQEEKEKAAMGITDGTHTMALPETALIQETIVEEDEPHTDAESFVTASRHESDNESLNSVATARGPEKSPSLVSTNFDDAISHISTNYDDARSISSHYTDAQSSVYFSSNSANGSNRSSVASMPDLQWDLTGERIQTYQPNINF